MNKIIYRIIKEYHRFINKNFKKNLSSITENEKVKLLSELLDIEKYSNYIPELFLTHPFNQNEINILKQNLDKESEDQANLLINRIFSHHIKYDFFLKENKFRMFTEKELELQKTFMDTKDQNKFNELKHKPIFVESVYRFHNGLKFLPQEILNEIQNKDIIDGGGFLGESAFVFLEYAPRSIHTFEPNNQNYENMIENINYKQYTDKIIPVKAGIADKTMEINASGTGMCFSICSTEQINFQTIKCISLDDYVNENMLEVGLIKLDIEGYELEAIKGATETIKKYKPIMLISIYHNPKDFFGIKPYLESLNLGYKFMIRKLDNSNLLIETMLICY
jgi:FkbM family methyltransferase